MAQMEFCLPPADLPRLLRTPAFGRRAGRPMATELIWHDTASGALAADQLSLCQAGAVWRLERSAPRPGEIWPPGAPPPLVAEAADPAGLGPLPAPLMPMAGFRGECRVIRLQAEAPVTLSVLHGVLRGVAQEQPVCRLVLDGPPARLVTLSLEWAAGLPLALPPHSLATEALALARGQTPAPRQTGSPRVRAGMTVADGFALIVAHLTDVILAGVPAACTARSDGPVHELRVAVRRLRSAFSVFGRVLEASVVSDLKPRLGALAKTLGDARDWDVFLAGTGRALDAALPDDPRIRRLLDDAARQRGAAYAALRQEFDSAAFRQLVLTLAHLAALRPWEQDATDDQLAVLDADARAFAGASLARQYRRLTAAGHDIGALPEADLHALRKKGKRLRYTAEFFADFYADRSTRRFLRRMAHLQEALGHLNDGVAAATLMQPLAGGARRQFAIGAVQGFAAAGSTHSRDAIVKSWMKAQRAKPFWL